MGSIAVVLGAIAVAVIAATCVYEWSRNRRRSDVHVASCLSNLSRLRAVAESGLMDGPRRVELDALTSEAARRLRAPSALMMVLDDKRAFIASSFGIDSTIDARRQLPAQQTYCKYVVARDAPLNVNDSLRSPLVKNLPATANGTRSYLGVPVRSKSGLPIGSFCVVDSAPRRWTADDRRVLEELASRAIAVAAQLANAP